MGNFYHNKIISLALGKKKVDVGGNKLRCLNGLGDTIIEVELPFNDMKFKELYRERAKMGRFQDWDPQLDQWIRMDAGNTGRFARELRFYFNADEEKIREINKTFNLEIARPNVRKYTNEYKWIITNNDIIWGLISLDGLRLGHNNI